MWRVICAVFLARLVVGQDEGPIVRVAQGLVQGCEGWSTEGRKFQAFRGIPYAQSPVGNLRFKPPQPVQDWPGILDARQDAPFCIQKNYFFANPKVEGSEDCLYLNVYRPETSSTLLPVMVFFHWGGFFAGRGTSDFIGPQHLMDKDIILVTLNYRLGVLGFLTTQDDEAPGNYALKDQVAALEWVQKNIAAFGGNPSQVTIFGQSAGGGSTHLHMLSPLSRGLFQRAISQSGSALALWSKPLNFVQNNITAAQAFFVGCDKHLENSKELISCLRQVPAETLVGSADNFKTFSIEPLTPYGVVTEVQSELNPRPFITKEPIDYIQNEEFAKVPWIIGTVEDEGILRSSQLTRQTEVREALNSQFDVILPQLLLLALSAGPNADSLYKNITQVYLPDEPRQILVEKPETIQGLTDIYTDRAFAYPSYQSAILHSIRGHQPIWFYNFAYKGRQSYGELFAATDNQIPFNWGVSHCDDLLYLFKSPGLFPEEEQHPIDQQMTKMMVSLWTNFAIFGDPTPDKEGFSWKWAPLHIEAVDGHVTNDQLCYLNITGSFHEEDITLTTTNSYRTNRMNFWANQQIQENFPELS